MIDLHLNLEPNFLNMTVPSFFKNEIFQPKQFFSFVQNNMLNELLGMSIIIGAILVSFSKEKSEDEYITKIRLESLVWAVYISYGILFISFILFYDTTFFLAMIINMFTVLLFFIIRFNWQISKLKMQA